MPAQILEDVIAVGGAALEAEDRHLSACRHSRFQKGGLLLFEDERYYQGVMWRELLRKYDIQLEFRVNDCLVDMVVKRDNRDYLFELKLWRDEHLRKVQPDIPRLKLFPSGGFLIVFSANPKRLTSENLGMVSQLPGIGAPYSSYRFDTENPEGDPQEFWIAGWPVGSAAAVQA